jgi:hypothetical protein
MIEHCKGNHDISIDVLVLLFKFKNLRVKRYLEIGFRRRFDRRVLFFAPEL